MAEEGARLAQMPEVAPFVAFCTQACGVEAVDTCVGAIFASATADPAALATSPVASLLSPETCRAGPRATADAARAVASMQAWPDRTVEPPVAALSSCAWDGVQASSSASQ